MSVAYEDNFGFWNIESAEDEAFFEDVRRRSVQRTCGRCESSVQVLPRTTLCARCVSALDMAPHIRSRLPATDRTTPARCRTIPAEAI